MKFLLPIKCTSINDYIIHENKKFYIKHIMISTQHNIIQAVCSECKPKQEMIIPFSHTARELGVTMMEYVGTMYEIGSFFIDFTEGTFLCIVTGELEKDEKGNWNAQYRVVDGQGFVNDYAEEELHQMEINGKIRFAFVDQKHANELGKVYDDFLGKQEFQLSSLKE